MVYLCRIASDYALLAKFCIEGEEGIERTTLTRKSCPDLSSRSTQRQCIASCPQNLNLVLQNANKLSGTNNWLKWCHKSMVKICFLKWISMFRSEESLRGHAKPRLFHAATTYFLKLSFNPYHYPHILTTLSYFRSHRASIKPESAEYWKGWSTYQRRTWRRVRRRNCWLW